MNNGEVYKCSSDGRIDFSSEKKRKSYAYVGGLTGIISGGLLMNSFSKCDIAINSDTGYAGGISGFAENASVQNVYSITAITQNSTPQSAYAGGIVGYSDNSYILGSVAINSYIKSDGNTGEISAYTKSGMLDNNYHCNSSDKSINSFKNVKFYFTPVYDGGKLGWDSVEFGGDVWTKAENRNYPFPVLFGVKNQENYFFN